MDFHHLWWLALDLIQHEAMLVALILVLTVEFVLWSSAHTCRIKRGNARTKMLVNGFVLVGVIGVAKMCMEAFMAVAVSYDTLLAVYAAVVTFSSEA